MPLPYEWGVTSKRIKVEVTEGNFPIRVVAKLTTGKARVFILVMIESPDRRKLLYDTLNTLTDLDYNIQHAEIRNIRGNCKEGQSLGLHSTASQRYYVLPRKRELKWTEDVAVDLAYGLQVSQGRRGARGGRRGGGGAHTSPAVVYSSAIVPCGVVAILAASNQVLPATVWPVCYGRGRGECVLWGDRAVQLRPGVLFADVLLVAYWFYYPVPSDVF